MTASDTERAMRDAVVQHLRHILPTARIIHELNVEHGTVRADIAAVTETQVFLFEIKSALDKLHRLSKQVQLFHPVCHGLIVVADEKWCGRAAEYPNCDAAKIIAFHGAGTIWQWPEPANQFAPGSWSLPRRSIAPWHHRMLRLLWTEELRAEARRHRIACTSRIPGAQLASDMVADLTGTEIEAAACRALRARVFAEADAPVFSAEAAE